MPGGGVFPADNPVGGHGGDKDNIHGGKGPGVCSSELAEAGKWCEKMLLLNILLAQSEWLLTLAKVV